VVTELAMASGDVAAHAGTPGRDHRTCDKTYGLARVFQGFRTGANASELRCFETVRSRSVAGSTARGDPE